MEHRFYDVKERKKVKREVISKCVKKDKYTSMNDRYVFKSVSEDGRPLVDYVSEEEYDKATEIEETEG